MPQIARRSCNVPVTVRQIPKPSEIRVRELLAHAGLQLAAQNTSLENVLRRNLPAAFILLEERNYMYQLTWQKFPNLTTHAIHSNEHDITRGHNYCRDNSKFMAELGYRAIWRT